LSQPQFEIASYLKSILERKSSGTFPIHSTFTDAVNFYDGELFFTLTNSNLPLSPMNILIYDPSVYFDIYSRVGMEQTIKLSYPFLKFNTLSFSLTHGAEVNTKIESLPGSSEKVFHLFKRDFLDSTTMKNGAVGYYHNASGNDSIDKKLCLTIHQLKSSMSMNNPEIFRQNIIRICGLGKGLTPSGDDFLYGFLAASKTFSIHKNYTDFIDTVIEENRISFGDISWNFLDTLRNGHIYLPLKNLFRNLSDGKDWISDLKKILSFGETSGSDMIAGVICALDNVELMEVN
jgi:hypothetical protein